MIHIFSKDLYSNYSILLEIFVNIEHLFYEYWVRRSVDQDTKGIYVKKNIDFFQFLFEIEG